MPRSRPYRRRPRQAFTLVEMLVTVSIFLFLATLTVAFMPKITEKQRATRGASQLQGFLAVAKQWAKRDQSLRGIRLLPGNDAACLNPPYRDSTGAVRSDWVHEIQYVDQPPDWSDSTKSLTGTFSGTSYVVTATSGYTIDFFGGFAATDSSLWPVQVGDYFQWTGTGGTDPNLIVFRVTGVTSTTLTCYTTLTTGTSTSGTNWSVIRAPRPRAGEAPLSLPDNVAIDVSTNVSYSNSLGSGVTSTGYTPPPYVDILFDPSGAISRWSGASDKIQLWVRDISQDPVAGTTSKFNGDQLLITIYVRTGLIAAHPVDVTSSGTSYTNPYSFTQDGRSSGF